MNNVYKILRDDVEIIHLGKVDDGTLLSIERKHFNFFSEVGKKVIVFQGNGEYIIAEEDTENSVPANEQVILKHKSIAGIVAYFTSIHNTIIRTPLYFLETAFFRDLRKTSDKKENRRTRFVLFLCENDITIYLYQSFP